MLLCNCDVYQYWGIVFTFRKEGFFCWPAALLEVVMLAFFLLYFSQVSAPTTALSASPSLVCCRGCAGEAMLCSRKFSRRQRKICVYVSERKARAEMTRTARTLLSDFQILPTGQARQQKRWRESKVLFYNQ
jgi:hypothetical protein